MFISSHARRYSRVFISIFLILSVISQQLGISALANPSELSTNLNQVSEQVLNSNKDKTTNSFNTFKNLIANKINGSFANFSKQSKSNSSSIAKATKQKSVNSLDFKKLKQSKLNVTIPKTNTNTKISSQRIPHNPAYKRLILKPVSPDESRLFIENRKLPKNIYTKPIPVLKKSLKNSGSLILQPSNTKLPGKPSFSTDNTLTGSLATTNTVLARALTVGQPNTDTAIQNIFQYVYNNIDNEISYGVRRGAFGCLMDGRGNDFDECALMVALINQLNPNITCTYNLGSIQLTPSQVQNWLNVDTSQLTALSNLLAFGGIPNTLTANSDGSLNNAVITHLLLQVTNGSTAYVFDPSFKQYTYTSGVDLTNITGFNFNQFIAQATLGASLTTNPPSVQNLNQTNIQNLISAYANNLINWIKNNQPNASTAQIIGGKTIVQVTTPQHNTSLPYQDPNVTPITFTSIPSSYNTMFEIQIPGGVTNPAISVSFSSNQIYGQRLTLFYNYDFSNNTYIPVLYLNGSTVATGTAISFGDITPVEFTTTFPYAGSTPFSITQDLISYNPYFISTSFGGSSRQMAEYHRSLMTANIQAGYASDSEPVLGESLAMMWFTHSAEQRQAVDIVDSLNNTYSFFPVDGGLTGFSYYGTTTTGAPEFDIQESIIASSTLSNVYNNGQLSFDNIALHGSAFECAVIQQLTNTTAVNTAKILTLMNTNGFNFYFGNANNWASVSAALINTYGSATIDSLYNRFINNGFNLILPQYQQSTNEITLSNWTGYGYYSFNDKCIGTFISNGLQGGSGTQAMSPASFESGLEVEMPDIGNANDPNNVNSGRLTIEPIDLFTGNYLYAHNDLSIGSTQFPYGLTFTRYYSSGSNNNIGSLGAGFTHNYNINTFTTSDGYQGMGSDSPIDGAGSIAEIMVTNSILSDLINSLSTSSVNYYDLVVAAICNNWFIDNLTTNEVIVNLPNDNQAYILLPNGTFNAPLNTANKLNYYGSTQIFTLNTPQNISWAFNANGQVFKWANLNGISLTYIYDSSNRLSLVRNTFGHVLYFNYNYSGNPNFISSVNDETGRSVSYTYSGNNLTAFTDENNNAISYAYDANSRMLSYILPAFNTTNFVTNTYDTLGRVETQADALSNQWTYYLANYRTQENDPNGNSRIKFFNKQGSVYRDINQLGQEIDNSYDGLNRVILSTMPQGNSIGYTYDSNNNVLTTTANPEPGSPLTPLTSTFTYHPYWNKVTSSTDPLGNTYNYNYDLYSGNLLSIQEPNVNGQTPVLTYTYNNVGQVLTSTDETGIVTQFNYSPIVMDLISIIHDYGTSSHLNLTTSFSYDNVGNLLTVTDPNGNTTNYSYNVLRQLTQSSAPLNDLTQYSYDANSNVIKVQSQSSDVTNPWQIITKTYNAANQVLTSSTQADNYTPSAPVYNTTTFTYDNLRRLSTTTDPIGNLTTYNYDALSRISSIIAKLTNTQNVTVQTNTYTLNGKLATISDANSNTTSYTYDGLDRLITTTYPDASTQSQTYDNDNNVLSSTLRNGNTITFTYDALNRALTNSPQNMSLTSYTYDLADRVLTTSTPAVSGDPSTGIFSYGYDTAGRLISETTPDNLVTSYTLDNNSNTIKLTYPDSYYVSSSYDALNRLTNIYLNGSTTSAATYAYDDLSRVVTLNLANGASSSYSYYINNDLNTLANTYNSTSNVTFTYGFNANNQITTQWVSDNSYMWHPASGGTTDYTANNLNQYTSVGSTNNLTYDKTGNLLTYGNLSFTYDTLNQLTKAINSSTTVNYEYDPLNRQTIKNVTSGNDTRYLYSSNEIIATYNQATGTLTNRYIHGLSIDDLVSTVSSAGTVTYCQSDQEGSIVANTDSSGNVLSTFSYSPFGESNNLTASGFGYTGQLYDSETGLYNYKARYYSPSLGRFLQPDPIGYSGGLNLYTYTVNDPLNLSDIFGLDPEVYIVWHNVAYFGAHFSIGYLDLDKNHKPYIPETISAGPPDKRIFGLLTRRVGKSAVTDLNDQTKVKKNDNSYGIKPNLSQHVILIPQSSYNKQYKTPLALFNALKGIAATYKDSVPYNFLPSLLTSGRNSNSFVYTILDKAGVALPEIKLPPGHFAPGLHLLIPNSDFSAFPKATFNNRVFRRYLYEFAFPIPPLVEYYPPTDIADDPVPEDELIVLTNK